jgi:hypothetical protein
MSNNINITAFFEGWPGDPHDHLCNSIFKRHGGEFIGCGTIVAGDKPERDVEYDVAETSANACAAELRANGMRVKRRRRR